jgi:hypothetical protein
MLLDIDIIIFLIIKIIIILVSGLCFFLGYKLFVKGIDKTSGDFEVEGRAGKIKLLSFAPGTFLFLMGTIMICFVVFRSSLTEKTNSPKNNEGETIQTEDNVKSATDSSRAIYRNELKDSIIKIPDTSTKK